MRTNLRSILASSVIATVLGILAAACDGGEVNVGPKVHEFKPGETWTGYVENYKFQSGSDRIWLTFTTPTTGTVTFGAPAVENEVINPDVGYPAGLYLRGSIDLANTAERFAFTMRDPIRDDVRLQFSVNLLDIWTQWCAAQTPMRNPMMPNEFNCLANLSGVSFPDPGETNCRFQTEGGDSPKFEFADCGKVALCSSEVRACTCDAAHCEANTSPNVVSARLNFDLRLTDDKADGSSGLGRIYLTRQ